MVDDINKALGGKVTIGSTVSGTYTYLPSTVDSNIKAGVGDYKHSSSGYGMNLSIAGLNFKTDPAKVDYLYSLWNLATDSFIMQSRNNLPVLNMPVVLITWNMVNNSGSAISSTALPTTCPDFTKWLQAPNLTINGGFLLDPENYYAHTYTYVIKAKIDSCVPA